MIRPLISFDSLVVLKFWYQKMRVSTNEKCLYALFDYYISIIWCVPIGFSSTEILNSNILLVIDAMV